MKPQTTTLFAAFVLAGATAGCDWRTFDDLADTTWVTSSTAPEGMDSAEYPVGLIWTATADANGTRFVVAGNSPATVGTVSYAADGDGAGARGRRLSDAVALTATVNYSAETPAIAGARERITGRSIIAVGMPEEPAPSGGIGTVYLLDADSNFEATRLMSSAGTTDHGAAVAFAATDHEPSIAGGLDLLATAANSIVLYADVLDAEPAIDGVACAITPNAERARAVAAADVTADSDGEELLVTGGDLADPGSNPATIFVLAGSLIEAAATAADGGRCFDDSAAPARAPMVEIGSPGNEPDFGTTLLVADFNGNGTPDLVATAPSANKVYVFLDLDLDLASPSVPTPLAITQSGAVDFGYAVAAGDLDGDGSDELVIGDPMASPEGATAAGSVYLYSFAGSDFSLEAVLHDVDPEGDQRFGRAVLVAPFGGDGRHVLAVGSRDELFTYFQTPISDDVRLR